MNVISLHSAMIMRLLRGSRKGLWLMVICLLLASGAMGVVGLTGETVRFAFEKDGKVLLGGELDLNLVQRAATDEELSYIQDNSSDLSHVISLSTMARPLEEKDAFIGETLVNIHAVDQAYPLFGNINASGEDLEREQLQEMLAQDSTGTFGVLAEKIMLDRLGLVVGDEIKLGQRVFRIVATLDQQPDPSFRALAFGPKVMVSLDGLKAADLLQAGSLARFKYRVTLPDRVTLDQWRADFTAQFDKSGWRIRDYTRPMDNAEEGLDRTMMYLSLVSLITVLSAGIGIGNGVRRFLQTQTRSIASLRVVGATQNDILWIYAGLITLVALFSITLGMVIAVFGTYLLLPLVDQILPVTIEPVIRIWPIVYSYINGLLVTSVFVMLSVFSAAKANPGVLFRQAEVVSPIHPPEGREKLYFTGILAVFLGFNIFTANRPDLAAIFLISSFVLLAGLWGISLLVMRVSKMLKPQSFTLRYAIHSLSRPNAVTPQVIVSLGLGLTVLVLINALSSNITHRLEGVLQNEAPSFYFIDIQPNQLDRFLEIVEPYQQKLSTTPMIRGRFTHFAGVPVSELPKNEEYDWITRGDRAFTWASTWDGDRARYAPVVEGEWWPEDYTGEMLISFDYDAAKSFGLQIGDEIGLNLLGREFTLKISNFRKIDWQGLGMNFLAVLSPGIVDQAPHSNISSITVAEDVEAEVQSIVVQNLPNVSAIRLKDVLEQVGELLGKMLLAIRGIGSVSILVGGAVLISALAAVQAQKSYENQILRVIGANQRRLFKMLSIELILLGGLAALIAALAGNIIAFFIVQFGINIDYIIDFAGSIYTLLFGMILTLCFGMGIAWRELGRVDSQHLRNE